MSARRSVTILGATGSVGQSTIDLIERDADRFDVVALTANKDVQGLADAAIRLRAARAVIADEALFEDLRDLLQGSGVEPAAGAPAVTEAAAAGADWTMAAIVGCAGLRPTMAAIKAGKVVALANKEALVSAGALMTDAARASGASLLPVDSEHNAIFQCFDGTQPDAIRSVILTASGGPFRTKTMEEMRAVTPAQAVAHPNWAMGAKISVDSATLMNKGLELIEAYHLFPLPPDRFEIIIHPQSVIHSMVAYIDGSVLAQLGATDMRIPIAYTLAWPARMKTPLEPLDLVKVGSLDFEAPDPQRFPALGLARAAMREGGAKPAILNAANEIAVASFLEGAIGFLDISTIVGETLEICGPSAPGSIDAVLEVDLEARRAADRIKRRYLH